MPPHLVIEKPLKPPGHYYPTKPTIPESATPTSEWSIYCKRQCLIHINSASSTAPRNIPTSSSPIRPHMSRATNNVNGSIDSLGVRKLYDKSASTRMIVEPSEQLATLFEKSSEMTSKDLIIVRSGSNSLKARMILSLWEDILN